MKLRIQIDLNLLLYHNLNLIDCIRGNLMRIFNKHNVRQFTQNSFLHRNLNMFCSEPTDSDDDFKKKSNVQLTNENAQQVINKLVR